MFKRNQLRQAVAAALLTASAAGNLALAVDEVEPNDRIFTDGNLTAQRLVFTGTIEVNGAIGVTAPAGVPVPDVDFYAFDAVEGDNLSIDIDQGMKPFDETVRSVDTIVAIFGPLPSLAVLDGSNDTLATTPRDPGSDHIFDALVPSFRVPRTGTYVVGVSSKPRSFEQGGATTSTTVTGRTAMFPNGSYKLIISGVTSATQQINIAIKPGSGEAAPMNPKARGKIPVAILSHRADPAKNIEEFKALEVKTRSLKFGSTGDEYSYVGCNKEGVDVNADGLLDLVCHFDNQAANWDENDVAGILKGETSAGKAFEGRGWLKVKPPKSE